MGETPKTQNFVISSAKLSLNYKIAGQKCHQFCSMVKFVEKTEQNSDFAKLRLEFFQETSS
jgi:hypothetical protein